MSTIYFSMLVYLLLPILLFHLLHDLLIALVPRLEAPLPNFKALPTQGALTRGAASGDSTDEGGVAESSVSGISWPKA
jgi:hypothetical protein